jgi:O-antigen ligase
MAAAIGAALFLLVPSAFLARLSFDPVSSSGKRDARTVVWDASMNSLSEYFWRGVGEHAFATSWGPSHGFARDGVVLGAHNAYVQITIFWGVAGLMALLTMLILVWRARGAIARRINSAANLATVWVVLLALRLSFTHSLYDKSFAVLIGTIVGLAYSRQIVRDPIDTSASAQNGQPGVAAEGIG